MEGDRQVPYVFVHFTIDFEEIQKLSQHPLRVWWGAGVSKIQSVV